MKNNIQAHLANQEIKESSFDDLYIVDYKNINNGDVEMLEQQPRDVKCVYLKNNKKLPIYFAGFKENLFGPGNQQCECVVFPQTCEEKDWVLFVECKYAQSAQTAKDKGRDYPKKMIDQIIATVGYFRDNEIMNKKRRATAIISFPNLMNFSGWVISAMYPLSLEDILIQYNILIRATNSATIKDQKEILLNSN
ncbi:hypothetical protein QWY99_18310 [Flavobacterium branchiarum]|uniref:Restriction endonuclease n=1 Tax=Flavobacterium branchiarum TaxID=1114870 RepID=A0ABV5FSH8_9FLAO|nr:hypothetical protein [Flavobacterium branchiarum]MDN3674991.1 hypothetical protein [Flavobacterium branchiarum]